MSSTALGSIPAKGSSSRMYFGSVARARAIPAQQPDDFSLFNVQTDIVYHPTLAVSLLQIGSSQCGSRYFVDCATRYTRLIDNQLSARLLGDLYTFSLDTHKYSQLRD